MVRESVHKARYKVLSSKSRDPKEKRMKYTPHPPVPTETEGEIDSPPAPPSPLPSETEGEIGSPSAPPPPPSLFSSPEINQLEPAMCAICDEGGDLVFCDGDCKRHFHMYHTSAEAVRYKCPAVVVKNPELDWKCANCSFGLASCWECGYLGFAKKLDFWHEPSIVKCPENLCNRFYCDTCKPKVDGQKPPCPLHECYTCRDPILDMNQMVQCRRCPRAWHLECLQFLQSSARNQHVGREIFCHEVEEVKRFFIYCQDHPILEDLGTPARTHISWLATAGQ